MIYEDDFFDFMDDCEEVEKALNRKKGSKDKSNDESKDKSSKKGWFGW